MTRSERLFLEGKIEVEIYGCYETAIIIKHCNVMSNLRYIGTNFGIKHDTNIYQGTDNNLYAVLI